MQGPGRSSHAGSSQDCSLVVQSDSKNAPPGDSRQRIPLSWANTWSIEGSCLALRSPFVRSTTLHCHTVHVVVTTPYIHPTFSDDW